mmetsp:Transcript_26179/g.57579  ORF Transcript_26179/g.57579 Transcript_26179/m.57579 type:complete len:237 (+) Transcript_26179:73-783(+)
MLPYRRQWKLLRGPEACASVHVPLRLDITTSSGQAWNLACCPPRLMPEVRCERTPPVRQHLEADQLQDLGLRWPPRRPRPHTHPLSLFLRSAPAPQCFPEAAQSSLKWRKSTTEPAGPISEVTKRGVGSRWKSATEKSKAEPPRRPDLFPPTELAPAPCLQPHRPTHRPTLPQLPASTQLIPAPSPVEQLGFPRQPRAEQRPEESVSGEMSPRQRRGSPPLFPLPGCKVPHRHPHT